MKQVTRGHSPTACTQQQQVMHEQAVGPVGSSSRRRGDAPPVTAGTAGAEAPVASRVSSVRLRPVGPPRVRVAGRHCRGLVRPLGPRPPGK